VQGKERASWFTTVRNMLASIVSAVVLLYFLLASGDVFLRKLVRVLPGLRDRILAVEISRSIQADIGRYFATTTLINLGLGFLTATAMWLLSMPSPLLLGTIAAVLNFLPYIGSAMTLVAIVLVAAISFDTFWQIALPPLTYLALTAIEGQLVQPMLLGQRLSLSPVVLFVWMMIWGWLWGVAGLILAVPMLVALKICADRLDALSAVAEFIKR
jgi:predicted PurR-regulated permease PerM